MSGQLLTDREQRVLEAVVRTYVETAEPAASGTLARQYPLGISAATIRNTMSDLEDKGFLYHPHTSAGRMPTDRGYRMYVDHLLSTRRRALLEAEELRMELAAADRSGVELLLRRAAQVLGLITNELGVATGPGLNEATLERIELVSITEGKVLLVMTLRAGGVRTVFVDVPAEIPASARIAVAQVLNERLAGLTIAEVSGTLHDRLRDSAPDESVAELLNIFIESADEWLELPSNEGTLHLGHASILAEQPEFQSGSRLRNLLELTERTDLLSGMLSARKGESGLTITIGSEHGEPALNAFTIVTSEYHVGQLRGVIGVIGPTRMPYERIITLVEDTSALISEFLT